MGFVGKAWEFFFREQNLGPILGRRQFNLDVLIAKLILIKLQGFLRLNYCLGFVTTLVLADARLILIMLVSSLLMRLLGFGVVI